MNTGKDKLSRRFGLARVEALERRVLLAANYTAVEFKVTGTKLNVYDVVAFAGGVQIVGSGGSAQQDALLWNGGGTPIDLAPMSEGLATDGNEQVGYRGGLAPSHATLWRGSASSAVDLNPAGFDASQAQAVGGGQQVGYAINNHGFPNAFLWSGSAQSGVNLSPTKLDGQPVAFSYSIAQGTNGHQQVGEGFRANSSFVALLWSGTPDSAVDLTPAGFKSASALGISVSGKQQVGAGFPSASGNNHALVWTGTAASAVDLNPVGSQQSLALATNDVKQVGVELDSAGVSHAVLWSGTAASVINLQNLLPSNLISSTACSIDAAGDVFGYAQDAAGVFYAVEWLPSRFASFGNSLSGVAGVALSAVVGSFSDSNSNDKLPNFTATIDWGDGTSSAGAVTFNSTAKRYDVTGGHTYAVAGICTISIAVKDGAGASATIHSTANIVNPNPTPTITGSGSVNEGGRMTVQLSASDTGGLAINQWLLDWGDGTVQQFPGSATSASHIYDDGPATEFITATATDARGFSASTNLVVMVEDVAPTAVFAVTAPTTAGAAGNAGFSQAFDPSNADTVAGFRYSFDWNDDGVFEVVNSQTPSAPIPWNYLAAPGPHVIRGRIADKDGLFTDYTATVQAGAVGSGGAVLSAASRITAGLFSSSLPVQIGSVGDLLLGAGDWLEYRVDFGSGGVNKAKMQLSAVAGKAGIAVQLRLDDPTGQVLASFSSRAAGPHGQIRHSQNAKGIHDLYVEVVGGEAEVNWFSFVPIVAKHKHGHTK